MFQNYVAASLPSLIYPRQCKRRRVSSYDRTGGNDDRIYIKPGDTAAIADIQGSGLITHLWITWANEGFVQEPQSLRKVVLSFYWDNEENPSVLAPLGDFFGMGHAMCKNYVSEPLQMSPEDGKALNCWFPMPFRERALLTVKNECDTTLIFYYYVDYEEYDEKQQDELLYFHAQWHRENPTCGRPESEFETHRDWCFSGSNPSGKENYLVLDAVGKGHYVGSNINIHNFHGNAQWDWPGEGDDMIFIDGESFPSIHGTGTEDYVNMAWCPTQEYSAPWHGLILGGEDNWKGKISYYRYHIQDPIMFQKSIRVTVEHGHDNHRSDDWSSTAYWYQTEPHKPFPEILPVQERLPLDTEKLTWGE